MILKHHDGLQWLEFELLAEHPVIHACLTRHGGHSTGTLHSLNFGNHVGDVPKNVARNKAKVASAFGLDQLFVAKVCHGIDIKAFDKYPDTTPICDGISTQTPHLGLTITQADCQGTIFYDPIRHALANVHCGWRGNVQNIYKATVEHMKTTYQSNPKDLIVCISPSLGPNNAEFINYQQELPESFLPFQVKPSYFDLWAISEWQLVEAGVLPAHIQIARIDTFAEKEHYFSHRRSKLTGRQATFCALKNRA